ncbi:hypothetical protein EQJ87_03865 [Lactococcus kimchii]|nr:hypothetical protein EQJ87_03865 [Lactococcus sp. S-13]
MELSRYILQTNLINGKVYFNCKNNHSFLITNRLKKPAICEIMKSKIYNNLALFASQKLYDDILDID